MDYSKTERQLLKDWFIRFAETECKNVSPMYFQLSHQIANDDELIEIASMCQERQPMPNLFFGAVHYLLLKDKNAELAKYYPSIFDDHKNDFPFELFKQFCLDNKAEIIAIEQSRIVQTNALNRCAYLMPILSSLYGNEKMNIVDIGTSAGLTLHFDKYEYHYNDEKILGNSEVKINSEIRKGQLPVFNHLPIINRKVGIDQNPLDVKEKDNAIWLKALIWADRTARFEKMEQAIEIAQNLVIDFEVASTLHDFERIILAQEQNLPLFIFHTHALYQFTEEERQEFRTLIDEIGSQRNLDYLAVEGSGIFSTDFGKNGVLVVLTTYKNGVKKEELIAVTNGHANWIEWC
ncbi:MAG: hypothetical protein ACI94Y_003456 [Maribacter sp.]|jgi:hypothetical protein